MTNVMNLSCVMALPVVLCSCLQFSEVFTNEMVVSGTIGTALSLANMRVAAQVTNTVANVAVDVNAGLISDFGGISSDDDPVEIITGDQGESCLQRFLHK